MLLDVKVEQITQGESQMYILAQCPRCGHVFKFNSDAADRRSPCVNCGRLFRIPPLEQMGDALKVIKSANSTVFVDEDGNTYG